MHEGESPSPNLPLKGEELP